MEKRLLLFLVVVSLIFISGCATRISEVEKIPEETPKVIEEPKVETIPLTPPDVGLGNLCSGEEECINFCLDNRGRCEEYCKGKKNELCRIIFPPERVKITEKEPEKNCVSNTNPVFRAPFTDITKIRSISPPGGIAVGSQSRSYVSAKAFENGSYPDVPIYAPIDSTLEGITYAMRGSSPKGRPEYRLDFRASCEVTYSFDHIPYVIDKIKNAGPTTPASHTRTGAFVSIPVSAGEFIGYTDSTFVSGFDFFLLNYAKEVPHINPSRWTSEHNTHADCPYDYFPDELKTLYYSYFASAGGTKQDNPTCRSASRDVAGTLSGGWFLGSSTDSQGSMLLVGSDFGDFVDLVIDRENQPRFSVRDYKGKNPEDVKAGDTVCYFDADRNIHAFLKLLTDTEMGADIGPGVCPGSFPAGHEVWAR